MAESRWDCPASTLPDRSAYPATRPFDQSDLQEISRDTVLWDVWPIQLDDGRVAPVAGGDLWVVLSAPRSDNPDDRHNQARMRLFHRCNGVWRDCGALLPDGFAPGSREWSGSTRLDPETGCVTLWFTAAGRRGDGGASFEQRLFHCQGILVMDKGYPSIADWFAPVETIPSGGEFYADLATNQGRPGMIKGFRDPYWFRDPADGQGYILFTGSQSAHHSQSEYDGVIGMAIASDTDGLSYVILPPLINGDGQVNEMERPHVIVENGLYYLFWSSQRHVFAPGGLEGPTGLYGMVAPALAGPYTPLNGSGLVLANPPAEPYQAYAWQVIPETLEVISFVDFWGLKGRDISTDAALKAAQFGGTIAPMVQIALDGATSRVLPPAA